ncbi:MAG: ATP-dependent zinc metalloprotease FtsH [Candidatus Rokuibacteriota bacterium]
MMPGDNDSKTGSGRKRWIPLGIFVLLQLLVIGVMLAHVPTLQPAPAPPDIPYTQFRSLVELGKIEEITIRERAVTGTLHAPEPLAPDTEPQARFSTRIPSFGDEALLPALTRHGVRVRVADVSEGRWSALRPWLPMLIVMLVLLWALGRTSRLGGTGMGPGAELKRFLETSTREAKVPGVRFADIAGQDNAKGEVQEIVDYLRDPGRFARLGAEAPHGVLLMGPPGTGKTMLAKALAGEAGVPFFFITASEFIEMFVGVGASRVRNLFRAAKSRAPSIVFIDELDAVGRTRGTGLGGGHDEREQTLNQILAEMDGFEGHEAVIVLAATNRPDVLDPALLRPGRFDRHVTLDLPDRKDREAILRVHVRKVPLAAGVDLATVATATPGFSGADLRNLVNEAAILAARREDASVGMPHFQEARDKVILGATRALVIQPEERRRLAIHESGHAVVAYQLPTADPLYKVSIIPRGRSLGGTQQLPEQERHTLPEDYLKDRLAVMLGGRAAEREMLGIISSGADDDIRQATALARSMVARWGMSKEIGPVDLRESEEHPFLGREIAQPRRFSEASAEIVDRAVRDLLQEAEERALQVLRRCRPGLDRLIARLEREETLDQQQIAACLGARAPVSP